MKPNDILAQIFERIGATPATPAYFTGEEVAEWPEDFVQALTVRNLLRQANPAEVAECDGCECACSMPVAIRRNGPDTSYFIVCNRRSDVSRIAVPARRLARVCSSGQMVAETVSELLEMPARPLERSVTDAVQFDLGIIKGPLGSSHVTLATVGGLQVGVAGYAVPLRDLLSFDGTDLTIDRAAIVRRIENPVAGGGDVESAAQRRLRLRRRRDELKRQGIRAFLKQLAAEEGVSVPRIKQLLGKASAK